MGFTVDKSSENGSQKGSEKGFSRRCLECPLREYDPLGVRPIVVGHSVLYGEGHQGKGKM